METPRLAGDTIGTISNIKAFKRKDFINYLSRQYWCQKRHFNRGWQFTKKY